MDYPRDEIMEMASRAILKHGGPQHCRVYFKFTCPNCGTRCQFDEPNSLYEEGECAECGMTAPVDEAGYALHIGQLRAVS